MRRESTEKGHTELKILPIVVQRNESVVQRHEPVVLKNMQAKLDCTYIPSFLHRGCLKDRSPAGL